MTNQQQHPITLPPELVQQWWEEENYDPFGVAVSNFANHAAQWGADQELEACCEWLSDPANTGIDIHGTTAVLYDLRAARRPKPPSLKKQALDQLREVNAMLQFQTTGGETSAIRQALEALDD